MYKYYRIIRRTGGDILLSHNMLTQTQFIQHGDVSVYAHCVSVAIMCLMLARGLRIKTDENALVRGALLHDYFLYDWHIPDKSHRLHGFTHPGTALNNARRDFQLTEVEADMIWCHMFPMTITHVPHHRESVILCLADKIVATNEIIQDRKSKIVRLFKAPVKG